MRRAALLISLISLLPLIGLPADDVGSSRRNAIVRAVEEVAPAVVTISAVGVTIVNVNPFADWFPFEFPFSIPERREYRELGSGFIVDERGYILTNQHVIENADYIRVILQDGREFEAEVVGEDPPSDIALLRIEAEGLRPAPLGDSGDLMIGEWVIAIGNPFGTYLRDPKPTVTVGVVSALHRSIRVDGRVYYDLIQTDAAINPGNSGGPLVNAEGRVVGINTAIFTTTGGYQGIGFAIPIDVARRVMAKLLEEGAVIEPWVGVEVQELTPDIARRLGAPLRGVLVVGVDEGSPAEKAGVRRRDVIVSLAGWEVNSPEELEWVTRLLKGGERVPLALFRGGKEVALTLTPEKLASNLYRAWFGLVVQPLTDKLAKQYKLKGKEGVVVYKVERSSPLWGSGLKTGDLIYAVGGYRIRDMDDFKKICRMIRRGQRVTFLLERRGKGYRLTFTAR